MSFLEKFDPSDLHTALEGFSTHVPGTESRVRFKRRSASVVMLRDTKSSQEELLEIGQIVDEVGRLRHEVFIEKFRYAGAAGHLRMPYLDNEELVNVVTRHICQLEDIVLLANKEALEEAFMGHLTSQLVGQVYGLEGLEFQYGAGEKEYLLFRLSGDAPYLISKDLMLIDAAKPVSHEIVATYREVEPTPADSGPVYKLQIHGAAGHAGYTGLMTYHDPSAKKVMDILADVVVDKGGAHRWGEAIDEMRSYLETRARIEEEEGKVVYLM